MRLPGSVPEHAEIKLVNQRSFGSFTISDNLKLRIQAIADEESLSQLTDEALAASSLADFEAKLDAIIFDQI